MDDSATHILGELEDGVSSDAETVHLMQYLHDWCDDDTEMSHKDRIDFIMLGIDGLHDAAVEIRRALIAIEAQHERARAAAVDDLLRTLADVHEPTPQKVDQMTDTNEADYVWHDPNSDGWIDAWNGWYETEAEARRDGANGVGRPWVLNYGEGLITDDEMELRLSGGQSPTAEEASIG